VSVVVAAESKLRTLVTNMNALFVAASTKPEHVGNARQAALAAAASIGGDAILSTDADVLPLHVPDSLDYAADAVTAAELFDVKMRRWYDWAEFVPSGPSVHMLDYKAQPRPGAHAYVSGGAQVIGRQVIATCSYEGLAHHALDDVSYCRRALGAGLRVLPPVAKGLRLLHLDKLP
jgi:hypothetical protein